VKIVVPVKQVAQLDDDFELRDDGRDVDPDCVEWDLNEWDAFALEAAVQLGESAGEAEIVVVTVGDDEAEERLRACLAKGADRAVRVWDGGLVDADVMLVARLLAAVVEREAPDLVLCGVQSSDAVNGATGVALAGFLGLPRVAVVTGIDYDASGRAAIVERELEGGLVERLRVRTPALLTVQTGINEPRYASRRAIRQALEKPLEELTPADLGLDADAVALTVASRVTEMEHPPKEDAAELIEGGPAEVAARILAIVEERVG
jgi:electron transfer flavoprotein beta subunit